MKCSKCNAEMTKAAMSAKTGGDIVVSLPLDGKLASKNSKTDCYVCPECGYIELYACDPKTFAEGK